MGFYGDIGILIDLKNNYDNYCWPGLKIPTALVRSSSPSFSACELRIGRLPLTWPEVIEGHHDSFMERCHRNQGSFTGK